MLLPGTELISHGHPGRSVVDKPTGLSRPEETKNVKCRVQSNSRGSPSSSSLSSSAAALQPLASFRFLIADMWYDVLLPSLGEDQLYWVIKPCKFLNIYGRFGKAHRLHIQWNILNMEAGRCCKTSLNISPLQSIISKGTSVFLDTAMRTQKPAESIGMEGHEVMTR